KCSPICIRSRGSSGICSAVTPPSLSSKRQCQVRSSTSYHPRWPRPCSRASRPWWSSASWVGSAASTPAQRERRKNTRAQPHRRAPSPTPLRPPRACPSSRGAIVRRQALSLHGSIIISLPLGPEWNEFRPAVVRVRTAKSAVAGDHLLHAHFVGWQSAIVLKVMANISARAPRHLSGLADAKVEQHCHRYGHYDEHQSHGSPPARCRAPIPTRACRLHHLGRLTARRAAASVEAWSARASD